MAVIVEQILFSETLPIGTGDDERIGQLVWFDRSFTVSRIDLYLKSWTNDPSGTPVNAIMEMFPNGQGGLPDLTKSPLNATDWVDTDQFDAWSPMSIIFEYWDDKMI